MPIDLINTGINVGTSLLSSFIGAFRGMTDEESYVKQALPVVKPYVDQNGIPCAVYWYGFSWVLLPTGQVVDINGGRKMDDYIPNVADRWPTHAKIVQTYANSIQAPVANAWSNPDGVFDTVDFQIFYPQAPEAMDTSQIITPIATSIPDTSPSVVSYNPNPNALATVQTAGIGGDLGGALSGKTGMMIGIAAAGIMLALILKEK